MAQYRFKSVLTGLALALSTTLAGTALANNGQGYPVMAGAQMAYAPVNDGLYEVPLNKNELVRLPAPASAVIIADPAIADVSVHSSDTLLVIGRGYGETNLIVLDQLGRTMMNADIVVGSKSGNGRVRLYKVGEGRETYSCRPECNPAPLLGDGEEFRALFGSSNDTITNTIASGPTGGIPGGIPGGGTFIPGPEGNR